MTTAPDDGKQPTSPLIYPAVLLSLASLAWTTWSLVDLLGTGPIGFTVAAGADIIWGSVILAEARGLRVAGKSWIVPAFGWATLLVVAAFLAWHGIAKDSLALAAAGPFLPFGAKAIWTLALADLRDPAALTADELYQLAAMERGMAFEEQQHRIEMRRRAMGAELHMAEVSVDFDVELMRLDKSRELHRRRPLELEAGDAARITPHRTDAHQATDAPRRDDAPCSIEAPRRDDAPASPTASPVRRITARATAHRTDAVNEVPDGTDDAPLMRTIPARVAAPHPAAAAPRITDAAPHLDGLSKAAAVRAMRDADPTASAPQIVQRLTPHGIDVSDAYVRTVLSRINKQTATDGGYL